MTNNKMIDTSNWQMWIWQKFEFLLSLSRHSYKTATCRGIKTGRSPIACLMLKAILSLSLSLSLYLFLYLSSSIYLSMKKVYRAVIRKFFSIWFPHKTEKFSSILLSLCLGAYTVLSLSCQSKIFLENGIVLDVSGRHLIIIRCLPVNSWCQNQSEVRERRKIRDFIQ